MAPRAQTVQEADTVKEKNTAQEKDIVQEQPVQGSGEKKYEVSRENVPGCDDPKHGTTYITYSDGSIDTVEY